MLAAVVINLFNIRITSGLNTFSAWWHMVGVVLIVGILIVVPTITSRCRYVFTERGEQLRLWREHGSFTQSGLLVRVRPRPAHGPVHDHGVRRIGAHRGGDAQGVAWSRRRHVDMSVFVSVVFGFILLVAVTFAIPGTTRRR